MRILAVSDVEDEAVAASLPARAGSIDLVLGCGDLTYEYLDFVATAAAAPLRAGHGIHDRPDPAHRGFAAFRTFLRWFRPRYHVHGHTHVFDTRMVTQTQFGPTTVVNAYGARTIEL